jgi:AraC-like DNA-binding protein
MIEAASFVEALFDRVPDVVYFVKDIAGRYQAVNQTLVSRCGVGDKGELIGRTAQEVFPEPLGARFLAQDLKVLGSGSPISGLLELHLYPSRVEGWCVTEKTPISDRDGALLGLAGISRDLRAPAEEETLEELARAIDHLQSAYGSDLKVEQLAAMAGLSAYQFNRRVRSIFGISARQLIIKTRIDAASRRLRSQEAPISEIALACGYCDQSAFSRQFKATVGLTPGQYREHHRPAPRSG